MIKTIWGAAALLLLSGGLLAQSVQSSSSLLQFGTTNENGKDSLTFTLTNSGSQAVQCRLHTFDLYNHKPFVTPDSVFSLSAGAQRQVKVYFQPRHNIFNNSELVVQHTGSGGSLRIDLRGQGTYSRAYYNATQDLEGDALRTALNTRTGSPYTSLGYNTARIHMFHTIDNWKLNGRQPNHNEGYKNECVYTGRTISYNSALSTGTLNNAPYTMNTEHTWPQSQGATNEPMQSDLHHLYVSDGPTNSARGNKPLRWVPNPTNTYTGGSKADATNFEPRDVHKTGAAASILYFATRYYTNSGVNMGFLSAGQENDLREWLKLFPPDSVLRKRNDDIQSFQQNRNPYIDYPQFLDRMDQVRGTAAIPQLLSVFVADSNIQLGQVANGAQVTYRLVVVNTGNQALQLSNIGTTGTGLSISGSSSFSIARGEAGVIEVLYTGNGQNLNGQLQMTTNVPGRTSISIPITAGTGGGSGVSLSGFNLQAPFNGLQFVVEGDTNQVIPFRWQRSTGSNGSTPLYTFQLRDAVTLQPIVQLAALNDTSLGLPFGFLGRQLRLAGYQPGDVAQTQWLVTAVLPGGIQRVSTDTRQLGLRLGYLVSVAENDAMLKVYPNPVQNDLFVAGLELAPQLFDITGRQLAVATEKTASGWRLELTNLPAGTYVLLGELHGKQVQQRILKVN